VLHFPENFAAEGHMNFNFSILEPMQRYELLLSTIVPRPIALIISLNAEGALTRKIHDGGHF
jgi:hypothetical protein